MITKDIPGSKIYWVKFENLSCDRSVEITPKSNTLTPLFMKLLSCL